MTDDRPTPVRTIGILSIADGRGVVRLEDRFDTGIDDLWSALTEPERLARWLGEVRGELTEGGEFHARYFASGWEGVCRVQVCEPPRRFVVATTSPGEPDGIVEATLTAQGEGTVLVIEDRGVPVDEIAAYGAGDQIHLEDLAAYLAGEAPCDARARFAGLHPAYRLLHKASGDMHEGPGRPPPDESGAIAESEGA